MTKFYLCLVIFLAVMAAAPWAPCDDSLNAMLSPEGQQAIGQYMEAVGAGGEGGLSVSKIMACLIFGAIGFVAFVYGRKQALFKPMILGILLMAYPYVVSGTWALWGTGAVLTLLLFWWRD